MLNTVDYVIARYRVNAQPRQVRVDGDIALPVLLLPMPLVTLAGTVSSPLPARQYGFRDVNGPSSDHALPPWYRCCRQSLRSQCCPLRHSPLPLMVWPFASSAALITSSPAMVLMVMPVIQTHIHCNVTCWCCCPRYPCRRGDGTSRLHPALPPGSRRNGGSPSLISTVAL